MSVAGGVLVWLVPIRLSEETVNTATATRTASKSNATVPLSEGPFSLEVSGLYADPTLSVNRREMLRTVSNRQTVP